MVEISRLVLNRILISPLEFPLGNGDPGPHVSIEIWGLYGFVGFQCLNLAFYRRVLVAI
jgi:hypothetical protein